MKIKKTPSSFYQEGTVEFSGFSREAILSKADVEGEKLWNWVFERDPNKGAQMIGVFGIMGSGKTSILHHIAKRVINENPREIVYWREPLSNPFQVRNNGSAFQILCERRHPVEVKILTDNGLQKTDDISVRFFSGFKELLSMSSPGLINVVYLHDLTKWIRFIDRLKIQPGWQSVFFDEFEDVCPMRVSGKAWATNDWFANSLKEIRKSFVPIIYNTQNQMDLDYRVMSKTMMHIYLYGARKDDLSPIFKGSLQSLELGSAWLDLARARFGLIKFPAVVPRFPLYYVVPAWGSKGKKSE